MCGTGVYRIMSTDHESLAVIFLSFFVLLLSVFFFFSFKLVLPYLHDFKLAPAVCFLHLFFFLQCRKYVDRGTLMHLKFYFDFDITSDY